MNLRKIIVSFAIPTAVLCVLSSVCVVSCGGSGESKCQQVGNKLCQKACECGEEGKCPVRSSPVTLNFDDLKGCTDLYVRDMQSARVKEKTHDNAT